MTTEQKIIDAARGLAGPISAARLADVTGMPEGLVRQRMADLCGAGAFRARIVGTDKLGRSVIEYTLRDEPAEPKGQNRNDRNIAVRPVILALREAIRVLEIAAGQGSPRRPRSILDYGDRPQVELTDADEVAEARALLAKVLRLDPVRRQIVTLTVHGDDVEAIAAKMRPHPMHPREVERYLRGACDFLDGLERTHYAAA